MQNVKPSAGDSIEARCTKCRKNTTHVIVSLNDEGPVEVQCNACSRQHVYRAPTPAKKSASRRVVNQQDAERKEWETLRPSMNCDAAQDYSMTSAYKVKSLINHPIFGLGLVQKVVGSQKVEVLFEDGKKTMRCK